MDNLLDLSHTAFLHPGVPPLGLFALLVPADDGATVDHWTHPQWRAPSCLINDIGITRCGQGITEGTGIIGFHLLTPVNERRTRYHVVAARNRPLPFAPDDRHH